MCVVVDRIRLPAALAVLRQDMERGNLVFPPLLIEPGRSKGDELPVFPVSLEAVPLNGQGLEHGFKAGLPEGFLEGLAGGCLLLLLRIGVPEP